MKRYAAILFLLIATPTAATACPRYLGCGCHLAVHLFGTAKRTLWSARNWLTVGVRASHGCVDCVVVFSRGKGGHVGIVKGWHGRNPIVYSWGNARIGWYTAEYPASRVLGYRQVGGGLAWNE